MATIGSFDVPIYVKSNGEFVEIGSASIDVHGELVGDTVELSVDKKKEVDSKLPPPVHPISVIDTGDWLWHKDISVPVDEFPVKRSFWRRGAV